MPPPDPVGRGADGNAVLRLWSKAPSVWRTLAARERSAAVPPPLDEREVAVLLPQPLRLEEVVERGELELADEVRLEAVVVDFEPELLEPDVRGPANASGLSTRETAVSNARSKRKSNFMVRGTATVAENADSCKSSECVYLPNFCACAKTLNHL